MSRDAQRRQHTLHEQHSFGDTKGVLSEFEANILFQIDLLFPGEVLSFSARQKIDLDYAAPARCIIPSAPLDSSPSGF